MSVRVMQSATIDAPIHIGKGTGGFTIDAGVTLTLSGPITAPADEQIFHGEGNVLFGPKQLVVRPEWFGAMAGMEKALASIPDPSE